ncbi:MAG: glycosyltransferase family 4 protein [Bacteroidia bacterium]|nr:glycosyltransferase family 4 protein [Bacteroidia bacterium]
MQQNIKNEAVRLAIVSSHIDKSLQFEWFEEELQKRNIFHIHIIINELPYEPFLAEDLRKFKVPVYVFENKGRFSLLNHVFKVKALFKEHGINVVHTTLPHGNLVGQLAAILSGIKARITTCENVSWAFDFGSKKQMLIDKFTFKVSKKVIFVADSAKEFADSHWKINPDKIHTIYHGLKQSSYENITSERIEKLKKQLEIAPGDFIVGMIARMEFWKGHEYAINAMKNVIVKAPNVKLMIFGSQGSDYEKVMKQIKDLELQNHVFFKGFIDDPIALFQLFDVHLHVPINKYVENCGISIIEGMIAERPQILTLSGYAAQSAKNNSNALVVDYCNSKEIEEAILSYYKQPELRHKLSAQAKKDALASYSNEVKVNRHLEIYSSLIN